MKIVFLAGASLKIEYVHVMHCLILAEASLNEHFRGQFLEPVFKVR